jgi:adenine-specific DNA-methyltransferase
MGTVLDHIADQTDGYISSRPKAERKALGQFFTSKTTARHMAGMLGPPAGDSLRILDPGAGSGILSAAALDTVARRFPCVKEIDLACVETDPDVLPLLRANVECMKRESPMALKASVAEEDYLLGQSDDFSGALMAGAPPPKYDWVIGNPPYFKLPKDAPEAAAMRGVCHGAPNIYFLFAAMSLFNLREGGEMVYIVPRSWTSGAYFARFRRYLLENGRITDIHVFSSRRVFDGEDVLQETMIVKLRKTRETPDRIRITSSADSDGFGDVSEILAPYGTVVSGAERHVFLPTSQEDLDVLRKVNSLGLPMPSIGLKMKTGLVVDFRNRGLLRGLPTDGAVPFFYAHHIRDGRVVFPVGRQNEYLSDERPGALQENRNYLFVKRFTAKEEKRRLQCAVYLAGSHPGHRTISTQNKINFIDTLDGQGMGVELAHGLHTVFNSTLYDAYYRAMDGSTQVNASEVNSMPVPARMYLEAMGRRLMERGDLSAAACDGVLGAVVDA